MARSKNLRLRLSAGALLPLILAVATQAAYTLISQREAMDDGLENKARALAGLMVNVAGPSIAFDDQGGVSDGLGFVTGDPDFAFAAAITGDGRAIAFRGDDVARGAVAALLTGAAEPLVRRRDGILVAAAPVVTDGRQVGTVFIGLRTDAVRAHAMRMAAQASGISIVGIAIAVIVVMVLAGKIARRNDQMRLVLDNVDEALATVRRDGSLDPECSAAFVRWFGAPAAGHFASQIAGADADARMHAMLTLAWAEIVEGTMPIELLVDQFPNRLDRDGRHYRLDIKPLISHDALVGALLRIRDVTTEVETQRVLTAQREYVAVFERAMSDPHGVREFIEDTGKLVERLPGDRDPVDRKRVAHTIKGNAAIYGVTSVAEVAHRLEDAMAESAAIDPAMVEELVATWDAFATRVEHLLGDRRSHVDIPCADLEALADLAERAGASAAERLRALLHEPVAVRFDGFRRQMARVAERLGKPAPEITIDADGVRLPPDRMRPFWSAFAHLVRNALDHGIEGPGERSAAGKPAAGRIALRARIDDGVVAIEIADDGRGIPWDLVRDQARAAQLPADSHDDLVRALFADGISTACEVSETSGRGVGLAVVRAAVDELDGNLEVHSEPARGARFVFTFVIPPVAPRTHRWSHPSLPPAVNGSAPVVQGDH
jgi:signal transduction histidine kinase